MQGDPVPAGAYFVCAGNATAFFYANMATCPLEITVGETARLLKNNGTRTLLIDVREAGEVATARIPGATHIPMRQIPENLASLEAEARAGKHLLIHCHHGGRSMRVAQYLRANGIENVSNVAGGIDAWSLQIDAGVARY